LNSDIDSCESTPIARSIVRSIIILTITLLSVVVIQVISTLSVQFVSVLAKPSIHFSCMLELKLGLLGESGLACREGSRQAVLRVDTINTVDRVQVLDKSNLEACSGTLAGRDR
jgi:hypothetical protein